MQLNLRRYFSPMMISADVQYRKPDSRIFRAVIEHWASEAGGGDRLQPEECCMVGDVISRDIMGARRVGWRSILCLLTDKQIAKHNAGQVCCAAVAQCCWTRR